MERMEWKEENMDNGMEWNGGMEMEGGGGRKERTGGAHSEEWNKWKWKTTGGGGGGGGGEWTNIWNGTLKILPFLRMYSNNFFLTKFFKKK